MRAKCITRCSFCLFYTGENPTDKGPITGYHRWMMGIQYTVEPLSGGIRAGLDFDVKQNTFTIAPFLINCCIYGHTQIINIIMQLISTLVVVVEFLF